MKKITYISFFLLLMGLFPLKGTAIHLPENPKDTITIQIGKTKKIIIWVDDKKDLAGLRLYDLNKMISELSKTVDSLGQANQILIISDEKGEQFKIKVETKGDTLAQLEIGVVGKGIEEEVEVIEEDEEGEDPDNEWYKHDKDPSEKADNEKKYGIHFNNDHEHGPRRGTHHHLEFDIGMNNYLNEEGEFPGANNEQYAVRPWGSWFVGINSNFRTHVAGPLALQWGAGISWYNFKFEDDRTRLEKTPDELLFVQESRLDINSEKSKLTASYLNVNLVPMLDFRYKTRTKINSEGERERIKYYKKEAFRIGFGGYAGYRIGSHTKYKYNDGGTEKDKERDRFYLNNFRYGARLQLGFRGVDLFANYDLNDLFSKTKAPELHAVSFGIVF